MEKSSAQRLSLETWKQFLKIAKPFFVSEVRWKVWGLLLTLLALSFSINGLGVLMGKIVSNYMDALAAREATDFYANLFWFIAAILCAAPVGVMYRYTEEKFALLWRKWLTQHYLKRYFDHRSYYRINIEKALDNPDQRMTDEIRAFAGTTISFLLIILNAIVNLCAWTAVLWSLSKSLAGACFFYALVGSVGTMLIGRRLAALNFAQQKKEADFRYRLVQIRDNSESIALYSGEDKEAVQINYRLRDVLFNQNLLIGWYRNLGFFVRSYDLLKPMIPMLIVAPFILSGAKEIGSLGLATTAFNYVLDALSIVVSQFERLSGFAATTSRLGSLSEELDKGDRYCIWPRDNPTWITLGHSSNLILENLTVLTPNRQRVLIENLSLELPEGEHLLITGASGVGKSALFRTIAGLWTDGQGVIKRPELEDVVFLPQTPYMVIGTFRQQMLYSTRDHEIQDEELSEVLQKVGLHSLLSRVGGFDAEMDWVNTLSLGEQQRIAFARLLLAKPHIAFVDEATTALGLDNERELYSLLKNTGKSYVSIGHRPSLLPYHNKQLEILDEGRWRIAKI
jgi:vitamin B12/bleomycin/antimicrobial peptide transport system ATP-binding/permease protein